MLLNDTSDDYEEIRHLTQGLSEEVGFPVDEKLVGQVLRKLATLGLVDVFYYDNLSGANEFVRTTFDAGREPSKLWFMITQSGAVVRDENWDDTWLGSEE